MYEEKLKKVLFEKIRNYDEIIKEMSEIDDSGLSTSELFDTNDEYAGFCVQSMDLQDEINELMLDTKYAPLTMLTSSQIRNLDFFEISSDLQFEQNIEKHLNLRLLKLKEEMKTRLKQVKTLRLNVSIDQHIYNLYNQVIRCYVYGAFEASCVLCRAIAEAIADKYTNSGRKSVRTRNQIWESLQKAPNINKKTLEIYSKIGSKANKILHSMDEKTSENDTYEAIELLQSFIKKIYKNPNTPPDTSVEWV
ncbi:MAG: hypothetical protein ISS47_06065 [Candidatus Omnitrophica bacterium]|nr:hypothetical protein [Candidatus Omnitrophota bacterium]